MATWSTERARTEAVFNRITNDGYVVPGSRKKSMKGVTATANSPDTDIIGKLPGMRALSRDASMMSPLGISILRRHKLDVINSGLQLQSRVNRKILDIDDKTAKEWEARREAEFDMWCDSFEADFLGVHNFWELQVLCFFNMLLSGDVFFMLPWVERPDGFPYQMSVHVIDADLVRNPTDGKYIDRDIKGGVEKDKSGKVVAYHVWNTYSEDTLNVGEKAKSTRVPIRDSAGKQQIWHLFDPERLNQRRGVPLLAPVADLLRQMTRLGDAELMSSLVAAFFTVFVKDASGMNSLLNGGLPEIDTITGGGVPDPNTASTEPRTENDGNDLEMGYGNVTYLDDKKDITVAEPKKTDRDFAGFFDSLATLACSGANMPYERATMKYNTSFVAAKAAINDAWNSTIFYRALIKRRLCDVVYREHTTEAILRNRQQAPGYFDDVVITHAWTGSQWVGIGQGYLDPAKESKSDVINLNSFLTTFEDIYMRRTGGRWDSAMERRAQEEQTLEDLGLESNPAPEEIVGPDGQENEEDKEEGNENVSPDNS